MSRYTAVDYWFIVHLAHRMFEVYYYSLHNRYACILKGYLNYGIKIFVSKVVTEYVHCDNCWRIWWFQLWIWCVHGLITIVFSPLRAVCLAVGMIMSSVCLSISLWCCVLWLNDASYSISVWTSRNTILQLSTPLPNLSPQTLHIQNFHTWNSRADSRCHSRQWSVAVVFVTAKMSEQVKSTIGHLSNSWASPFQPVSLSSLL